MGQTNTSQIITDTFKNNWDLEFIHDSFKQRILTFGDLFEVAVNWKNLFHSLGIQKNQKVVFYLPNSIELLTAYFGAMISGIVSVPIDTNKGTDEVNELISMSGPDHIVYDKKDFNCAVESTDIKDVDDELFEPKKKFDDISSFVNLDTTSPFLVTFTSGSTGKSKGVVHSLENLVRSAIAFNQRFGFSEKNRFFHNLPMSYMAGILNSIILPFVCKSQIVLGPRFSFSNLANFWKIPSDYSVDVFWLVPAFIEMLLKLDRGTEGISYTQSKEIIGLVGTAPLKHESKIKFEQKYGVKLYESYGLSETLFVSTNYPSNEKENSTGVPLTDVELKFLSDGEILVKVPWMYMEYLKDSDFSQFGDGFYTTGDLGMLDENGFLQILGRKKDLIIKGGFNISPKRLEDFIYHTGMIEECSVVGIKNSYLGEQTVCFFVPKNGFSSELDINKDIVNSLGIDYRVDQFIKLDSLPRNVSGKIDKPKLKEYFWKHNNDY